MDIKQILVLFDISDLNFTSLLCSAFSWLSLTFFIVNLNKIKELTFSKLRKEFFSNYQLVGFFALFLFLQIILLAEESIESYFRCLFAIICSSSLFVSIQMIRGYDEVDFSKSQDDQCSIGAYWATGATQAYYEKCLKKFKDRLKHFEDDNPNVNFFVKKLVLIAPLSCNIDDSLKDRGEGITHVGDLEQIECDQGANINRHLITPVYKISNGEDIFIAAEFPSPLGALLGGRETMDKNVRVYIRDCFIKELKKQLEPYPVIILEYDDENPARTVSLNHFIVSSLQNYVRENNVYL